MAEVFQLLNMVQPIPSSLRDLVVDIMRQKTLKKRGFLLSAGQICRYIDFIRKRIIRCLYTKEAREFCSWFMKEGEAISIETFYNQAASYEYLQSLEETELRHHCFLQLKSIYQHFRSLNITWLLITRHYYQQWAQQVIAIRMQSTDEQYKWLTEYHPQLLMRVPVNISPPIRI